MSRPIARRLAARLAAVGIVACAAAAPLGHAVVSPGAFPGTGADELALAADPVPVPADRPTRFKVSSFNVLGYSHTQPGGRHAEKADGRTRMRWAADLIRQQRFDAIGLQELQTPQWKVFKNQLGSRYRMYPSAELGTAAMANSIAWNYHDWYAEQKRNIKVPYFNGNGIRMPYVLLRNRETGRKVWLYNNHHPADSRGNAEKWRNKATQMEIDLVNRLRKSYPNVPVVSTGDKNERSDYFCPVVRKTSMVAANGGGVRDGKCVPPSTPARLPVDWVMGTSNLRWSSYTALNTKQVQRITDHRVIVATGYLPSSKVTSTGVKNVVLINVQGLNSNRLAKLSSAQVPRLKSLIRHGASTLNARTTYERIATLPASVGEITSRPALRRIGGHGVGVSGDKGGTFHAAARRYVASAFDVVSDFGRGTALVSSHQRSGARAVNSYDGNSGRRDYTGLGNGRDKIDRSAVTRYDWQATAQAVKVLRSAPKAFTYLQLGGADDAAMKYGPYSSQYAKALKQIDVHVGRIMNVINSTGLKRRTVLIVTSDHGGTKLADMATDHRATYTVPFIVWGRGVAQGADLYTLNRHYRNPGASRPKYTATRDPIRNTYAANLVTKLLALPPVSGSNMDGGQTMTVFKN